MRYRSLFFSTVFVQIFSLSSLFAKDPFFDAVVKNELSAAQNRSLQVAVETSKLIHQTEDISPLSPMDNRPSFEKSLEIFNSVLPWLGLPAVGGLLTYSSVKKEMPLTGKLKSLFGKFNQDAGVKVFLQNIYEYVLGDSFASAGESIPPQILLGSSLLSSSAGSFMSLYLSIADEGDSVSREKLNALLGTPSKKAEDLLDEMAIFYHWDLQKREEAKRAIEEVFLKALDHHQNVKTLSFMDMAEEFHQRDLITETQREGTSEVLKALHQPSSIQSLPPKEKLALHVQFQLTVATYLECLLRDPAHFYFDNEEDVQRAHDLVEEIREAARKLTMTLELAKE